MSDLEKIVEEIIELGKNNDWFIEFSMDQLTLHDFIYLKGNVIVVDTSCIKFFINAPDDQLTSLEDQLREIIEVEIPEIEDHTLMIELKNTYL